jgi:O-antigen ligase
MQSSRQISKLGDDLYRLQRVVCAILTCLFLFSTTGFNPDLFSEATKSLIRLSSYGVLLFLLLMVRPKKYFEILSSNKLLFVLIAFSTISIIWSLLPNLTFAHSRSLVKSYLFAACFVSIYSVRDQIKIIQYASVAAGIASILVALLLPDIGIHYVNGGLAVRGIFGHKQSLGRVIVLASTTFIPFVFRSKSKIGFYLSCLGLLFCFAITYIAQSKTSIISVLILFLSLPFYILLSYSYNSGIRIRSLFFIISGLVALVFLALFFGNYETIMVDILGKGVNINGRVPVWILSFQEGMRRPILGSGYGAFWSSDVGLSIAYRTWGINLLYDPLFWNPGEVFGWHAHNGFLETFVNLGIAGLTLVLLNLGQTIKGILSKIKTDQFSTSYYSAELHWMFLVLLMNLFINLTEVNMLGPNDLFWISYMCIALNVSARRV